MIEKLVDKPSFASKSSIVLRRAYLRSLKPAALLLNDFWFSAPPAWAITETFSSVWPAIFLCPALKILAWPRVRLNGQLAQRNYGAHYQQSQKTEFNCMLTKSCHEFSPFGCLRPCAVYFLFKHLPSDELGRSQ